MSGPPRPTISRAALKRELGEFAGFSRFVGKLPLASLIPDYEKLKVGDVILSRKKRPDFFAKQVLAAQSERGHPASHAIWTHSMIYVGELHVVESNKPTKWKTGIQVVPLTDYCQDFELVILRHKDEAFTARRHQDIVRHGLLSHTIWPRSYDLLAALAIRFGIPVARTRILNKIICSEFVLECFAIGGGYMIEQFVSLREDSDDTVMYFLPADLSCHGGFERIEMEYYELVDQ